MRRTVLWALALTSVATTASAGGINLSWTDCGAIGAMNRTFACNTNAGTNCLDFWQGQGTVFTTYQESFPDWNSARILVETALLNQGMLAASSQIESYAFRIVIRNDASAGAPSCGGCNVATCIVLNEIELIRESGVSQRIQSPLERNQINWQGSVLGCPFVVPVVGRTWGQVKALYR